MKILGNGGFGIVFQGTTSTSDLKSSVYKFYKDTDDNEYNINYYINKYIDPFGKYHIPLISRYTSGTKEFDNIIAENSLLDNEEIAKFLKTHYEGAMINKDMQDFYISKYEFGGDTLYNYFNLHVYNKLKGSDDEIIKFIKNNKFNSDDSKMILKNIKNLFEGLLHFHNNNVIHGDIKLDNIMFDKEKVKSGHSIRFIDMGLSSYIDVDEKHDIYMFNSVIATNDCSVLVYIKHLIPAMLNKDEDKINYLLEISKKDNADYPKHLKKCRKQIENEIIKNYFKENNITEDQLQNIEFKEQICYKLTNIVALDILKKNDINSLLSVLSIIKGFFTIERDDVNNSLNRLIKRFNKNKSFYELPFLDKVYKTYSNIVNKL